MLQRWRMRNAQLLMAGVALLGCFGNAQAAIETIGPERYVYVDYTASGQLVTDHVFDAYYRTNGTAISADGRYVAFSTDSRALAPDTPTSPLLPRVYLRDIVAGTTTRIPLPPGMDWARGVKMSEDGKLLLFEGNNGLYLYALETQTHRQIYPAISHTYDISGDGRYVYYYGGNQGVMRYDVVTEERQQMAANRSGLFGASRIGDLAMCDTFSCLLYPRQGAGSIDITKTYVNAPHLSITADISSDGRAVVFFSSSANLLLEPYPPTPSPTSTRLLNMFLYDVESNTLKHVPVTEANGNPYFFYSPYLTYYGDSLAISNGGRFVVAYGGKTVLYDRLQNQARFLQFADGTPFGLIGASITPDGRYVSGWTMKQHFVRLDLQPNPVAVSAGADQTVEQEGPHGAYVALAGALSQGSCDSDQSFAWAWPDGATTGTNPTVFLPTGTTTVTLNWAGCAATASDTVEITVQDTTPPALTASVLGTAGDNGWYRDNLTVQLAAEDSGAGVAEIRCTLDGTGLVDPGSLANVAVTGDGTHSLGCLALDAAGNPSAPLTLQLSIDSQAPVVSASLAGNLYQASLYVSDVTLALSAVDTTSGVASVTTTVNGVTEVLSGNSASVTLSINGSYQLSYAVRDQAGNVVEMALPAIAIDKTLLANALYQDLQEQVTALPTGAFGRSNPNDASKLLSELAKVSEQLAAIPLLAGVDQQVSEYRWVRQKLTDKLLPECQRLIGAPQSLASIEAQLHQIVAAIDLRLAVLGN